MLDQNFQLISKKGLSLFSLPVFVVVTIIQVIVVAVGCGLIFLFFFSLPNFSEAEAEQMAKKADAWKEYKEAALVDMMMKVLPQVIIAEKNFFNQPKSGRLWIISDFIFRCASIS